MSDNGDSYLDDLLISFDGEICDLFDLESVSNSPSAKDSDSYNNSESSDDSIKKPTVDSNKVDKNELISSRTTLCHSDPTRMRINPLIYDILKPKRDPLSYESAFIEAFNTGNYSMLCDIIPMYMNDGVIVQLKDDLSYYKTKGFKKIIHYYLHVLNMFPDGLVLKRQVTTGTMHGLRTRSVKYYFSGTKIVGQGPPKVILKAIVTVCYDSHNRIVVYDERLKSRNGHCLNRQLKYQKIVGFNE